MAIVFPKISVITVVRNAPTDLEVTLSALCAMEYPAQALELIVIDGASTDSTPDVIERFADRISYSVSEPDRGLYDAMNKGISAATGEYLWFVNAGDLPFDGDVLRKIFADGRRFDIYYGDTAVHAPTGELLGLRKKPLPARLTWRSLGRGMVVCHQSFIVRRVVAPLYDWQQYSLVADIEWMIECLKTADSVCNTGLILSRFTTGGISSKRRKASLRQRWSLMCRHYGLVRTFLAHMGFVLDALRPDYRKMRSDNEKN